MELDQRRGDDAVIPPLALLGPDGRRVSVAVSSTTATVGELADSLGLSRRSDVLVDGRHVERRLTLDRVEIGHGSRLTERPPCRAPARLRMVRPVSDASPLGIAVGSGAPPGDASPRLEVVIEAGPAAGSVSELGPGRHVVGRAASARVRVDDDLVELHHAVIDVDGNAGATFTQISGRVPCRASNVLGPEGTSLPLGAVTALPAGVVVTIGASRFRLRRSGPPAAEPAVLTPRVGDPWRRTIHRPPRSMPQWDPTPIDVAVQRATGSSHAGGMLAAALGVVGGVAIAVVMRNPMFLVFSAVGLLVAVGGRLGGRFTERRQRHQQAAEDERERQRFAEHVAAQRADRQRFHRAVARPIDATLAAARALTNDVWTRRSDHHDAFTVVLGWGPEAWSVRIGPGSLSPEADAVVRRAQRLDDEPVLVDLGRDRSLAIVGAHAAAVVRSLVVQLATWTGPADWRLLVVADDAGEWEWCGWLPQSNQGSGDDLGPAVVAADDATGLADLLARFDDGDHRHVLVVTDRAELLSMRTGPLRRYLGSAPSVAVVAVVHGGTAVPAMCRSLLEVGSLGGARWCPDTSVATTSSPVHASGVSVADADDAARRLARLHDPEDPSAEAGVLPATVSLSGVMRRCGDAALDDPIAIAASWRSHLDGDVTVPAGRGRPRAAIGLTADGVVEIDLVGDGPHALIAGTTGSGKSELLRTLVVGMAARCSPELLTFVLIDYKGGSTFDACADLPHTVGVVTDLDDRLAGRALSSLEAEIRRRERLLRNAAVDDLDGYWAARPGLPLPRLVVVVDEFAAMAAELPGFLSALVGVAQRGRSLGIHLVLATQRPAGVVSDEIRANTNLRIALRLQDRGDANDIVGDAGPSGFARGTPGRAMMRLGPGDTLVFQTARSSAPFRPNVDGGPRIVGDRHRSLMPAGSQPHPSELVTLTRSIRGAASLCEVAPPFRPWLEPLTGQLDAGDLMFGDAAERTGAETGAVVGVIDDPGGQRRLPLHWLRGEGNLALVGSFGSGTTTALKSVVIGVGDAPHVYVIDARGDGQLDDLGQLPNCGGVIGANDAERRGRLLGTLEAEIRARQSNLPTASRQPLVLAVDGLSTLNTALSGPADVDEHGRLARILSDGVPVGVHAVATFERPGAVPASMLATFGQRWLFHLDDPLDATGLGVRAAMTPPATPGRIVVVATRLEAQVAMLPFPGLRLDSIGVTSGSTLPVGLRPAAIDRLPDDVDAARMSAPSSVADGLTGLVIGVDFATLLPITLDVPDGEHVVILGPARSGRSTALVRSVAAWRVAHPDGRIVVRSSRRVSPVSAWMERTEPDALWADDDVTLVAALAAVSADRSDGRPLRTLLAIDDAERVDDLDGSLLGAVSDRHPELMVVAAGRPDTLRTMYGHWTAVVRRSRIGLVMSMGSDADGELLGEALPRRRPVAARPGLAWLFDGNGRRLVQIARDDRNAAR